MEYIIAIGTRTGLERVYIRGIYLLHTKPPYKRLSLLISAATIVAHKGILRLLIDIRCCVSALDKRYTTGTIGTRRLLRHECLMCVSGCCSCHEVSGRLHKELREGCWVELGLKIGGTLRLKHIQVVSIDVVIRLTLIVRQRHLAYRQNRKEV